jgi:hypothetical protein
MLARRHLEVAAILEPLAVQAVGHEGTAGGDGVHVDPGLAWVDWRQGAGASPSALMANSIMGWRMAKLPLAIHRLQA